MDENNAKQSVWKQILLSLITSGTVLYLLQVTITRSCSDETNQGIATSNLLYTINGKIEINGKTIDNDKSIKEIYVIDRVDLSTNRVIDGAFKIHDIQLPRDYDLDLKFIFRNGLEDEERFNLRQEKYKPDKSGIISLGTIDLEVYDKNDNTDCNLDKEIFEKKLNILASSFKDEELYEELSNIFPSGLVVEKIRSTTVTREEYKIFLDKLNTDIINQHLAVENNDCLDDINNILYVQYD